MASIPADSFNGNKEEQNIISAYIVKKQIKMSDLFEKLTTDMETNKWVFKDSTIITRYAKR
jgi:hypothetical protein